MPYFLTSIMVVVLLVRFVVESAQINTVAHEREREGEWDRLFRGIQWWVVAAAQTQMGHNPNFWAGVLRMQRWPEGMRFQAASMASSLLGMTAGKAHQLTETLARVPPVAGYEVVTQHNLNLAALRGLDEESLRALRIACLKSLGIEPEDHFL